MSLRPYFFALPLVALGCAEATPAPVVVTAPAATAAPVTELNLTPPAAPTGTMAAAAKPGNNPDPQADRKKALEEAAAMGMIGLLNSGADGDPTAQPAQGSLSSVFGNDGSVQGNMWGSEIGDAYGVGGLGLSGVGAGGGGTGQGTIGLGSLGTMGHGAGTGTGQGFGSGAGRIGSARVGKPPSIRMGATSVTGRLPPEVVQRIVRQNFGRFRYCYENGLRTSPDLTGKVSVRFVIDDKGATTKVSNAGSDLPSKEVVACVLKAFNTLSFPTPEGGVVVVVYPIMFTPGERAPVTPPPAAAPKAPPAAAPAPAPKAPPVDLDEP
jgi:hypothetical protein